MTEWLVTPRRVLSEVITAGIGQDDKQERPSHPSKIGVRSQQRVEHDPTRTSYLSEWLRGSQMPQSSAGTVWQVGLRGGNGSAVSQEFGVGQILTRTEVLVQIRLICGGDQGEGSLLRLPNLVKICMKEEIVVGGKTGHLRVDVTPPFSSFPSTGSMQILEGGPIIVGVTDLRRLQ